MLHSGTFHEAFWGKTSEVGTLGLNWEFGGGQQNKTEESNGIVDGAIRDNGQNPDMSNLLLETHCKMES